MSVRLASMQDLQSFMKGGAGIDQSGEKMAALEIILDDVSDAIQNEVIDSCGFSLLQSTSDGISAPLELYGSERYGRGKRNKILLRRFPVISVASVIDTTRNNYVFNVNHYSVDPNAAIIYLKYEHFFPDSPLAVQVVYTAGYAEIGSDATRKLAVPNYLRKATLAQCQFEFSRREPGSAPIGATTISRPDGSMVTEGGGLLKEVQQTIARFKQGRGF
jgi:hypothetical protein